MPRKITSALSSFWFTPPSWQALALFRIVFGAIVFGKFLYQLNSFDLRFSSHNGFLLSALPWPFHEAAIPYVYAVVLVSALCLTLGIFGRLSALICLCSVRYLHGCSIYSVQGVEVLMPCFLFYLALCDSTRFLTVWPRQRKPGAWNDLSEDLSAVGFRLFQIQLCIIYFYAFKSKLASSAWQNGEALWMVVQRQPWVGPEWTFLLKYPLFLSFATWMVLAFETYFSVLIWVKPVRKYVLGFGVIFHALIGIMLGLPFFSAAMIAAYIFFLDPKKPEKWAKTLAEKISGHRPNILLK